MIWCPYWGKYKFHNLSILFISPANNKDCSTKSIPGKQSGRTPPPLRKKSMAGGRSKKYIWKAGQKCFRANPLKRPPPLKFDPLRAQILVKWGSNGLSCPGIFNGTNLINVTFCLVVDLLCPDRTGNKIHNINHCFQV